MNRLLIVLVIVAVATVAVGAKQILADDPVVYHACVKNSGAMFLVESEDDCHENETYIDWSQSGNPDPACWDNTNRYVDCGNGTVNDTVTNLLWLKNANCFGTLSYANANAAAAGLADGACGLTDNSSAGDWRLPTKAEWEETIAQAMVLNCDSTPNGDISLTNTPGTGCYGAGPQPFTGVQSSSYFSASAIAGSPAVFWAVRLSVGGMHDHLKAGANDVWPVRDGQ